MRARHEGAAVSPRFVTVLRSGKSTGWSPRPLSKSSAGDRRRRDHVETEQLDVVAVIVLLALLVAAQVGGQVLLVVVAEHGGHAGAIALLVRDLERAQQVCSRADAHRD